MTTGDKVLVYGTLLSGMRNHHLLLEAEFVADYEIEGFLMLDLGMFPGCIRAEGYSIQAELYNINKEILDNLDILEGYPNLYDRIIIETEDGPAHMYILNELVGKFGIVPNGDWKTYIGEKNARRTK